MGVGGKCNFYKYLMDLFGIEISKRKIMSFLLKLLNKMCYKKLLLNNKKFDTLIYARSSTDKLEIHVTRKLYE